IGNRSAVDAGGLSGTPGTGAGLEGTEVAALVGGMLLIGTVLAGNAPVCVSRTLQTPTNYFIVSLALALSLGLFSILILSLAFCCCIHSLHGQVQGGVWLLRPRLCDALTAMDVLPCTTSIFNLCAISVDRWVSGRPQASTPESAAPPRGLATVGPSAAVAARVWCSLSDVRGRDPAGCQLEDRRSVVCLSVRSFFLPCPPVMFLYRAPFRGPREVPNTTRRAKLHSRAPRRPRGPSPTQLRAPLSPTVRSPYPAPCRAPEALARPSSPDRSQRPCNPDCPLPAAIPWCDRPRSSCRPPPGAFLVCWTRSFVVHITRALCPAYFVPSRLVSAVTWLGYVNNALNPIVYTIFNTEFCTVFSKSLSLRC
uniref:Dopamine receptor D4 n=1 Tax=Nannospalax galili TaxID=1026970 RepID=A0A8C6RB03_NANGA